MMTTATKKLLQTLSISGLALSVVPAFLVFRGSIETQTYFNLMLLGMLLWFGTAIFWVRKDDASK